MGLRFSKERHGKDYERMWKRKYKGEILRSLRREILGRDNIFEI